MSNFVVRGEEYVIKFSLDRSKAYVRGKRQKFVGSRAFMFFLTNLARSAIADLDFSYFQIFIRDSFIHIVRSKILSRSLTYIVT